MMKKAEISQESLEKLVLDNSSAETFRWNCLSNDDLLTIINLLNVRFYATLKFYSNTASLAYMYR